MNLKRSLAAFGLCAVLLGGARLASPRIAAQTGPIPASEERLPLEPDSVRFAVIGDNGTGEDPEYRVADEMERFRQQVKFTFVIMLGDNIYGGDKPKDFTLKFEKPYKALLDAGVTFYASLGNHDNPTIERAYKPFNMGGNRFYTFKKGDVQFFALDSNYMDPDQLTWLEQQLRQSSARWKICFFHHPLFNNGKMHGPDVDLRTTLMPLFERYKVNVVFSGHEHVYQRLKVREGIHFFICGNSGKLEKHDLVPSPDEDVSIDTQRDFMLVEIKSDKLSFETVSEAGQALDSGSFARGN